jgi:hypothetical protein
LSDPRFGCRSAIEVGPEEIDPGFHVYAKPNAWRQPTCGA